MKASQALHFVKIRRTLALTVNKAKLMVKIGQWNSSTETTPQTDDITHSGKLMYFNNNNVELKVLVQYYITR